MKTRSTTLTCYGAAGHQKIDKTRIRQSLGVQQFDAGKVPLSGSIVAGMGVNLSSRATCSDSTCRIAIADNDYSQILHFFDSIVMEGPSARQYLDKVLYLEPSKLLVSLVEDVKLMLHLRTIGLSNYIVFASGLHHYCSDCAHRQAVEMGLADFIEDDHLREVAKQLSSQGRVTIEKNGPREWWGGLEHPQFDELLGTIYE
jgi:hypothetical protein